MAEIRDSLLNSSINLLTHKDDLAYNNEQLCVCMCKTFVLE